MENGKLSDSTLCVRKEADMPPIIYPIRLSMPLNLGAVNCYLIDTGSGFILVDTGTANRRRELEIELSKAGCIPGNLKLIVITHGDFDHTGNVTFLRSKYSAKVAIHKNDAGMLQDGDMFFNRKQGSPLIRLLAPLLMGFGKAKRCAPDLFLDEGDDLREFGLDAGVLSIPGHSLGSIALLTSEGDLFSGDLLDNTKQPGLTTIMDDPQAGAASLERLKALPIETVYPGHGSPFLMDLLLKSG
jgi:hydroxyacylglutathione hydrolase